MKKLGIIIPCYNCENTIIDCINSIVSQKESDDCQIILINDGSSDKTEEMISNYSDKENFVIYNQINQGVSLARNKGIDLCNSEYIMFVDSDDMLYEDGLKKVFDSLKNSNNSLSIYGINQEFYKNGNLVKNLEVKSLENEYIEVEKDLNNLIQYLENNLINGPYAKIFDLKIIKENKIRFHKDLKIQEDLCFNIQYISNVKKINLYSVKIYRYLINGSVSITNKFLPERMQNYRYVEKITYDFFKDKDLSEKSKNELYYISIKDAWSSIINTFYPGNNLTINGRMKFIKNIINQCDYQIIKKARRSGIKYYILKIILQSKNLFLIYLIGGLFSLLKRKMYISYK